MYSFEKKGRVPRDHRRMEAFRYALDECQLMDIGYSGTWFTWERGNLLETNIRKRLDRGVANDRWMVLFPRGNVQHLPYTTSDHCPLLINIDNVVSPPRSRRFHFESWWILEESLEGIVRDCWASSSAPLVGKLELLQVCLKKWACGIKNIKEGLKRKLNDDLEVLLQKERDDDTLAHIIDTKIHLNMEIEKDEMYWEQRARSNWLKLGDRNTAYFHKCATIRRRGNAINKLFLDDGKEITDCSEITKAATEINDRLLTPFRGEEVWLVLKEMGPTKAPGSYGFPAIFFQKFWYLVGEEVTEFCLSILNGNRGAEQINVTEIVLIPKTTNPISLVNFRPISLCSVLYKIVAKAIVNRLQGVMGLCIDEVQSAFVPGRVITDNTLVAYEILHTFRKKRTGKKGFVALKLDMSKTYDRVEWNFVKNVMIRMGFTEGWVSLIMKCVTSVFYAININGCRGRIFQSSRGLRQGLSSLLRIAKANGAVKGARASRGGPEISHLLFADDCMLFRQCVNYCNSTIFYSSNTTKEAKAVVSSLLGVRSSSNPEKYIGLPNMVDRINSRIDGWSNRLLSQGGKEVFIKSVLQAIPTYAMSCFLLPKSLCEKIESKRGIHWSQWRYLCRPKEEGSLRFRNLAQFNIALLSKQGWRLLQYPKSLVAKVFKAKYFSDGAFCNSLLGNSSSYVWRSIWATKKSLAEGLSWRVGTGTNISVFEDAWVPNYANRLLMSDVVNAHFVKVAELISNTERNWNEDLIKNTFPDAEAELILQIPLALEAHDDLLVWNGEATGEFSVRSSYKLLQNSDPTTYALQNIYKEFYKKIWRIDIPSKIKIFVWKASWNFLSTRVNLSFRKLVSNSVCFRCLNGAETTMHLFRDCPVSHAVWKELDDLIPTLLPCSEFLDWLTKVMGFLFVNQCRLFCTAL
ncbi:reverse transcriptase [Gossypium australe]|uniref:Reverse transcriptase n=1 Tax=Gossypium australe TaxID=47621 RepID=A0A5B6WG91_9ROSI|nr:reverse transcriptase [Gossypium australe]